MTKKEKRIIQNYYNLIAYLENNKRYNKSVCDEYPNGKNINIKRHIISQTKVIAYSICLNKLKEGVKLWNKKHLKT